MSTGGLGLATGGVPSSEELALHKVRAEQIVKSGAGWFVWIAALSLINSLVMMSGSGIHFILGLGVTQLVDAIAQNAGRAAMVPGLIIDAFALGVFVLFWHFARKGQKWAFIVGMFLYTLDGLLLLLFRDFLSAGFHAYALFMLYRGLTGVGMLQRYRQAAIITGAAAIEPK